MAGDSLVQIVDAALAEAVRKGGAWIACKPGCYDCCLGPFPITPSDAARLREGMSVLDLSDPQRAARIRARASVVQQDDDPCPLLDPEHGTCDLYDFRPLTCRVFGPALAWDSEAVAVCEKCFVGATDEEIARCSVSLDSALLDDTDTETTVAEALTKS